MMPAKVAEVYASRLHTTSSQYIAFLSHMPHAACLNAGEGPNMSYMVQVRWQGWDSEGRPLMLIRIARACDECTGDAAESVANAVISQVCPCDLVLLP